MGFWGFGVLGVHPLKHISYEAKLGVVEIQLLTARKTTKRGGICVHCAQISF